MLRKRTPTEIDRDRLDIAASYLAGKTLHTITEWLNKNREYRMTVASVSRDLEAVRLVWRERATKLISERKAEELARLDRIESEAWDAWERSKKDAVNKFGQRKQSPAAGDKGPTVLHEEVGTETKQRDGNPKFLELVARCVERRLDVLGISQNRVTLTGPGGGPIQTQDATEYDNLDTATILRLNRVLEEAASAGSEHASAAGRN